MGRESVKFGKLEPFRRFRSVFRRPASTSLDFDRAFSSGKEWRDWMAANPIFFDRLAVAAAIDRVSRFGFSEPLTGINVRDPRVLAAFADRREGLVLRGTDYNVREGLVYKGLNSRMRAVLKAVGDIVDMNRSRSIRIYTPEAVTDFALRLRGLFPKFLGSEYTNNEAKRRDLFPIPVEDLTRLSFADGVFDVVIANDVLEHVPDLDRALREMCRVLKPGGWHIGTVPFLAMSETSQIRARIENGQVRHLMEPEYHEDPMSPDGALVFELPGWDILARARAAGFSEASMRAMMSENYAYLDYGGVLVLCFRK